MKRIPPVLTLALTLAGAVLFSAGCANLQQTAPANRPLTYALVATVNGSQAPTDAQWSALLKKFETLLAARGVKLLVDPSLADKLIQVQFYPDADDPTMGTIYVVGISTNPGATLVASSGNTPTRTTSSYASNSYYSSSLYPQYYGYFNNYNSDYGYNSSTYTGGNSSGSTTTTPPTHTTKPVICPPDSGNNSGHYAGHHPPSDGGRGSRPYPESGGSYSSGSSSSGSSYSSSGSSYSSSGSGSSYSGSSSSYSSGSSSYSSGSSSGSSSYSTPSYSPPSYESSSSSSRDGGSQQQPR